MGGMQFFDGHKEFPWLDVDRYCGRGSGQCKFDAPRTYSVAKDSAQSFSARHCSRVMRRLSL